LNTHTLNKYIVSVNYRHHSIIISLEIYYLR